MPQLCGLEGQKIGGINIHALWRLKGVIFIVNFDGFNLDSMLIDSKFIDKISNNVNYNFTIKDYYYKLAGEVSLKKQFFKIFIPGELYEPGEKF